MNRVDKILGKVEFTPEEAYYKALAHRKRFKGLESIIVKDPEFVYRYAKDVIKGRWPEAEPTLFGTEWSYYYARNIIKGRWPEGEPHLSKTPLTAFCYARDIIKGRWLEGEPAIANDPEFVYLYARDVVKGRWPEGEKTIAKSEPEIRNRYVSLHPEVKDEWVLKGWVDWMDS